MGAALEITGLTKDYGSFKLKDINMTIPGGSIMGLIGENGAGKTTLIKLILGLTVKDGGTIRVLGRDHIEGGSALKEEIGVVFDENYFHESFKVRDIEKVLRNIYRNFDSNLFRGMIERFQLPFDKTVKEFSRGMKMKLNIASAAAHRPKLLILDEATSGLDPVVRDEMLDIFLDFISDEEHSILFSSHITSDLEKIADYITLLDQGAVVFSREKDLLLEDLGVLKGTSEQLRNFPAEAVIKHMDTKFRHEALVRNREACKEAYPELTIDHPSLEEVMLFYIKGEEK